MTKYEFVRLRGMRLTQLERGAPPLVNKYIPRRKHTVLESIFEQEMREKCIPYVIKRVFPDGAVQYIRAGDLDADRWLDYCA